MKKKKFGFKRILAAFTSAALMLSSAVTVMADVETSQVPQPTLKMTILDSTVGEDKTITDSVTGREFDVFKPDWVETISENLPEEKTRNYVRIKNDGSANTGAIRFSDGDGENRKFTRKDKTTVEMWARVTPNANNFPLLFMFTPIVGENDNNYNGRGTDFCYYSSGDLLLAASGASSIDLKNTAIKSLYEKWTHCVFTRLYDAVKDEYTVSVYVDGEKIVDEQKAALRDGSTSIKKPEESESQVIQVGGFWQLGADIGALNVYDQVLTADQVLANYNSTKETYELNTVDTFNVTAVSPEDGSNISVNQGSIKVSFDNDIDASSIDDAEITLKDGSNNNVDIKKEMSADEKSLIVKFGKLTKGETYTLTVKNLYSKYNVKSADLAYMYTATVDSIYFDSDVEFEKLKNASVGDKAPTLDGMVYTSGNTVDSADDITVQRIGTGDSAPLGLRVVLGKGSYKVSSLKVPTENVSDNGYIIADYKVRGYGNIPTNTSRKLGGLYGTTGGANASVKFVDMSGTSIQYQNPDNTSEKVVFKTDADKLCYIRTVLTKNADGKYVAYLYDLNDNAKKIAQYTTKLDDITDYCLIFLNGENAADVGAELAYAKVYNALKPEILNTEYTNDGKVNVLLNTEVKLDDSTELIIKNTVTSAEVNVYVSVDSTNANKLIIEPKENGSKIDKNASYTINLSSIISADGIALPDNAVLKFGDIYGISGLEFKDQGGNVLKSLTTGTTKLTAAFNFKSANSGSAKAIMAIYDGETLVKVECKDVPYGAGVSVPINMSADGFAANDNYSAKIMMWSNDNKMTPITGAETFN